VESKQTYAERTSAADKAIGFDYQYYYFLYRVLKLGLNQSVGLEVKDDVHTDLDNDRQILIQLKHTTQKNIYGAPKSLTTFDVDLWKTLSNWSCVIADSNSGRISEMDQLAFISKTEFMLVSNKSQTSACEFFEILENSNIRRLKIEELKEKTRDLTIQKYINNVLILKDAVLEAYLNNVVIELDVDEIILRCKNAILEKQVPDNAVDQLFRDLDSNIRQDNFISIRVGEKIVISFDDFKRKYGRYFQIARNPDLKVVKDYQPLPSAINEQTFIKQLVDIGDINDIYDIKNKELMIEYTNYMLMVKNSLDSWCQKGDLTIDEISSFNKEAKLRWRNKFRAKYRQIKSKSLDEDEDELALDLLDEIREERLIISSQQMDTDFSNGEFYYLSDKPEIGWRQDWEEKYK
jgi:hypothetical protein